MTRFGLTLIDVSINEYLADFSLAKHTYDDFSLRMVSMYIPMPEPKTQLVNLPFASGSVDLTEAAGVTPYADRTGLNFEFVYFGDLMHWPVITHDLANYLHGKKIRVIVDNDLEHYYECRLELDSQKSSKHACKIVLTGTSEPFKYSLLGTDNPWLWDPFSFVDGEIVSTADIVVNGNTNVAISAGGVPTSVPLIVTQAGPGLGIIYNTNPPKTLYMPSTGTYVFPQIKVGGHDATVLNFVGSGRVTISYRKKYL